MRQRFIIIQGESTIDELIQTLSRSGIPAQRESEQVVMIHWPQHGDQETFWRRVGVHLRTWLRRNSHAKIDLAD